MSVTLARQPDAAAQDAYDLIVVGGGVYGVTLALEAARRGLRPLLLERGDLGGGVSWNSLRIVHGGLRYLQSMDLKRYRESVGERRWFMRHFPNQVRPLPCLMPLYGKGMKRPGVFRVALKMNDWMSRSRNAGVPEANHLGGGRVLGADALAARFPGVRTDGLQGGALWHDGQMVNSQRLMMEMYRWAGACGAVVLNYTEALSLEVQAGKAVGVVARDLVGGGEVTLRAPVVVNAAGPWCAGLAEQWGGPAGELFIPSLAFNMLLDRAPLSDAAVAVTPCYAGARTYFVHNERHRLLAGTYHAACGADGEPVEPLDRLVAKFIDDLNDAVPGMGYKASDVVRVYAGQLPAASAGDEETSHHPVWVDHAKRGGPRGLVSVSGVKYTTARRVAEQTLFKIDWPGKRPAAQATGERPADVVGPALDELGPQTAVGDTLVRAARDLMQHEAVVTLEDLMLRRTAWALDPRWGEPVARALGPALGFDTQAVDRCVAALYDGCPRSGASGPAAPTPAALSGADRP